VQSRPQEKAPDRQTRPSRPVATTESSHSIRQAPPSSGSGTSSKVTTAPVAEGPKTPGQVSRDRNIPSRETQKPVVTKTPEAAKPVQTPKQNPPATARDYGRSGNPATTRTAPALPAPKQNVPENRGPYAERATGNDYSSPRSTTTHEYVPKTSPQHNDNYSAPGRSYSAPGHNASPSYSPPPARAEHSQAPSHSESSGGSTSRGNSGSHDDSGSHGKGGKDR